MIEVHRCTACSVVARVGGMQCARSRPCSTKNQALTDPMRVCNRSSKREALIGISGVWKGFFITASASAFSRLLALRMLGS